MKQKSTELNSYDYPAIALTFFHDVSFQRRSCTISDSVYCSKT